MNCSLIPIPAMPAAMKGITKVCHHEGVKDTNVSKCGMPASVSFGLSRAKSAKGAKEIDNRIGNFATLAFLARVTLIGCGKCHEAADRRNR